jgi:hypothetical protein
MRIFLGLLFMLLAGCGEEREMKMDIALGGSVNGFIKSSPVEISSDCSERLHLCFHEFDFPSSAKSLPTVSVHHGLGVLSLDHVVGMNIFENFEWMEGKLKSVDLTLRGVPSRSDVPVAKNFAYSVIQKILDGGWTRYISTRDPRIPGNESAKLLKCEKHFDELMLSAPCFDPGYEMSDEQWWNVGMFYYWYFYKDGFYLTLKAWRSRGEKDPVRHASYLFTLEFESEQKFWLSAFQGEDRVKWKELLPALLEKHKLRRKKLEDDAERAGIAIDRTYQDPPIAALQQ